MQPFCRPSSEVRCHLRLHTISQGDDYIKIVMGNVALHITFALLAN